MYQLLQVLQRLRCQLLQVLQRLLQVLQLLLPPGRHQQPLQLLQLYNSTAANGAVLLVTLSVSSPPTDAYPTYRALQPSTPRQRHVALHH